MRGDRPGSALGDGFSGSAGAEPSCDAERCGRAAGVRRRRPGGVLNLTPLDVKAIAQPKRGDVALDDGSNTSDKKPAIAIFDGKQWIFR